MFTALTRSRLDGDPDGDLVREMTARWRYGEFVEAVCAPSLWPSGGGKNVEIRFPPGWFFGAYRKGLMFDDIVSLAQKAMGTHGIAKLLTRINS